MSSDPASKWSFSRDKSESKCNKRIIHTQNIQHRALRNQLRFRNKVSLQPKAISMRLTLSMAENGQVQCLLGCPSEQSEAGIHLELAQECRKTNPTRCSTPNGRQSSQAHCKCLASERWQTWGPSANHPTGNAHGRGDSISLHSSPSVGTNATDTVCTAGGQCKQSAHLF